MSDVIVANNNWTTLALPFFGEGIVLSTSFPDNHSTGRAG
jgi:hypothetical protein